MTAYIKALLYDEWRKVIPALVLMVGLSLLEGVGLLMLLPMLAVLGVTETHGLSGSITASVATLLRALGIPHTLAAILGLYTLIITGHAFLMRCQALLGADIQHSFVRHLSNRLYTAITYTTWSFVLRSRASDFTQVLTSDLLRVGQGTYHLLRLVGTGIITGVYVALAVRLSPLMSGLSVACAALLLVGFRHNHRLARSAGEALTQARTDLYSAVTEHLGGMKVAKSYGAEQRHTARFAEITATIYRQFLRFTRLSADTKMGFDIGAVVALSVLFYLAVELLHVPVADLLLLLFLFARLLPKCATMQQSYQQLLHMLPAFSAAMALQERCLAAAEPPHGEDDTALVLERAVEFRQVGFRYETAAGSFVMPELSCTIAARQTTALVGPSGAGKSTMADLLMGFLVPDTGEIRLDGVPLNDHRLHAWRRAIGYVPQETFLFHDTIRTNLLWARPEASDSELHEALRQAAADEIIAALPQGLDTIVGDRGVRLSGGERQRLALARALLRQPSLLLLDEATSALDAANERRIQHALARLHGVLTIVLIAHRLSTIRMADRILVVEAGRLVETGTWDDLYARPGSRFRAMVQADRRTVPAAAAPPRA